jgi:hypothetical protein
VQLVAQQTCYGRPQILPPDERPAFQERQSSVGCLVLQPTPAHHCHSQGNLGRHVGETYKYFQVQIPSLRCCAIMVCCRMHSRNMASEVTGMRCSFASNIAWIYEEPLRQHVSLKSLPYRGYIAANWPTYMNAHHNFLVMSSSRPSKMQQDCCPSLRRASISPATRYPDYEMHVDVHTAQCYPHAIPPAMS